VQWLHDCYVCNQLLSDWILGPLHGKEPVFGTEIHTGGVTVNKICTGFEECDNYRSLLQLGPPFCCGPVFLVVVVWAPSFPKLGLELHYTVFLFPHAS
jgi:hypothetical protein